MEKNDSEYFSHKDEENKYNIEFTNYSELNNTMILCITTNKSNFRIDIPIDIKQLENWIKKQKSKPNNINKPDYTISWF
jgi:hypothetical protein